jgi:hypothetical protein
MNRLFFSLRAFPLRIVAVRAKALTTIKDNLEVALELKPGTRN